MIPSIVRVSCAAFVLLLFQNSIVKGQQAALPPTTEGDFVAKNFKFRSGETLPELRLHYATLGKPVRDAQGRVTNAVLILHGTGGTGQQFLQPVFAGELFGPGQLLDVTRYFIILPDGIGHGKSSKPSDGLHAHFPSYDYDDMVAAHHQLLSEGLGVNHLRLILGTSMGCMHSFVWGETYPDFMDALMPLACQPVQIAGRNRIWRKMVMDAIRNDPEWKGGEYSAQPQQALRTALDFLLIAGSAPLYMQKTLPTRDAADEYLDDYFKARLPGLDANDFLYQVNASRNYDPSPNLEKITTHVMYINSADDFINPPELSMAERETKRVKNARFVLIPISDETRGHGTHTRAIVWKQYLAELLEVPGFAGKWLRDDVVTGNGNHLLRETWEITLGEKTVTRRIFSEQSQNVSTFVYKLDGTDSPKDLVDCQGRQDILRLKKIQSQEIEVTEILPGCGSSTSGGMFITEIWKLTNEGQTLSIVRKFRSADPKIRIRNIDQEYSFQKVPTSSDR